MLAPYRDAVAQARSRETESLASLRGRPANADGPAGLPFTMTQDGHEDVRHRSACDDIAGDSLTETYDADAARREAEPFLNKWGPYRLTRDPITENDVRRFCEVVEDGNPVYWDEEFAKASRFGRLISPPQSLFAMTFGAWWTPGHVEASLAAQTAALNQDTDAVDSGAIFAICERFGYVVNTVAGQETEYIAPFGPGDGRIKMRSMTVGRLSREDRAGGQGGIYYLNHRVSNGAS